MHLEPVDARHAGPREWSYGSVGVWRYCAVVFILLILSELFCFTDPAIDDNQIPRYLP